MRTCANVAHGLGRDGGYAPLESAGEYVCECLQDGDRVFPKWGERAVHERVVRCRDCCYCTDSPAWPGAFECDYINRGVEPDGFCAWGERRAQ